MAKRKSSSSVKKNSGRVGITSGIGRVLAPTASKGTIGSAPRQGSPTAPRP